MKLNCEILGSLSLKPARGVSKDGDGQEVFNKRVVEIKKTAAFLIWSSEAWLTKRL